MKQEFDVVIVGGGHNSLVAACYLGKAGLRVAVLEKNVQFGGATVSQKVFPDFEARLSRYSYLVSLLPDQIIEDLGLTFTTLSRSVSSYTPFNRGGENLGLLVNSDFGGETESSFIQALGSEHDYQSWLNFYDSVKLFAQAVAPTMLSPLPTRSELKSLVNDPIWEALVERPLGEILESTFESDLVRGVIFTDALVGTFSDSQSLFANICFIYHVIGNGAGQWRVPRGGMGGLVFELLELAKIYGVTLLSEREVHRIEATTDGYETTTSTGEKFASRYVLANCAPQTLARMIEMPHISSLDGSQVKINMLLKKLPRLKSGVDPREAFAGTFHIDESYSQFQKAFDQANRGEIPDRIPAEMYCHTLTDPSILSEELQERGFHTLTLFAFHTPASLFDVNPSEVTAEITARVLRQLNEYLLDPIEECLAVSQDGSLCIEAKNPLDIEVETGLPRGNIFQKDLSMPFKEDGDDIRWGVETAHPNLFLAGAGAIRGGGVSGIPGHNAAAAVLEAEAKRINDPLKVKG